MKNKQRLLFRICFFLFITLIPTLCYAETNNALLKGLAEDNINKLNYPLGGPDVLRTIGWWFLKLFASIVDSLYSGVGTVIKKMGFAGSKQVQSLVSTYHDLLLGVLIISVTCLGFWLIWKVGDRRGNIAQNILICVLVVASFPLITNQLTKYTTAATSAVIENGFEDAVSKSSFTNATGKGSSGSKGSAISSVVVASQIVDLKMVKDKGKNKVCWRKSDMPQGYIDGECILGKKWRNIDINTVMEAEAPFDKYYDGSDYVDTPSLLGSIGKGKYYRYQILSWFEVVLMMAVVAFVLFFALLKIARLIIDAAFAEIYMPFIATTDLVEGQRTKEAIKHFVSIFAAIFLCVALIGLYFVGFSWVESNFKGFLKLVMHFALAWAVIDGPDIIERIIGIDVGVKSGYQALMGAHAATSLARDMGQGTKNLLFGKDKGGGKRGMSLLNVPKNVENIKNAAKPVAEKFGDTYGLNDNNASSPIDKNEGSLKSIFDTSKSSPSSKNLGRESYSGNSPNAIDNAKEGNVSGTDNNNLLNRPNNSDSSSVSNGIKENQRNIPNKNIGGSISQKISIPKKEAPPKPKNLK